MHGLTCVEHGSKMETPRMASFVHQTAADLLGLTATSLGHNVGHIVGL